LEWSNIACNYSEVRGLFIAARRWNRILIPVPKVNEQFLLAGVYLVGIAVLCKLSRKYLLDRSQKNIVESFGVSTVPGKLGGIVPWTALLTAAGIVGDLVVVWISDLLGVTVHWTEWFDEDLVWGNHLDLSLLLLGVIVFGPIFEELLFRDLPNPETKVFVRNRGWIERCSVLSSARLLDCRLFRLSLGWVYLGVVL